MQQLRLKCRIHPNKTVFMVDIGQSTPFPSRLLCAQCIEGKTLINCKDLEELLANFSQFLGDQTQQGFVSKGPIDELRNYFKYLDYDLAEFVDNFYKKFLAQIEDFKNQIVDEADKFRQWKQRVQKAKTSLADNKGHKSFVSAYQNVINKPESENQEEWKIFENTLNDLVDTITNQNNQEIIDSLQEVKAQREFQAYNVPRQQEFIRNLEADLKELKEELEQIYSLQKRKFTDLIEPNFQQKILDEIQLRSAQPIFPNLVYSTKREGFNLQTLIEKCKGLDQYLLIIQSRNEAFGGYTSCQFNLLGEYQIDQNKASFIFSTYNCKIQSIKEDQFEFAVKVTFVDEEDPQLVQQQTQGIFLGDKVEGKQFLMFGKEELIIYQNGMTTLKAGPVFEYQGYLKQELRDIFIFKIE